MEFFSLFRFANTGTVNVENSNFRIPQLGLHKGALAYITPKNGLVVSKPAGDRRMKKRSWGDMFRARARKKVPGRRSHG